MKEKSKNNRKRINSKNINRIVLTISKVSEICYWVLTAVAVCIFIFSLANRSVFNLVIGDLPEEFKFELVGLTLYTADIADNQLCNLTVWLVFGAIIDCSLLAMIFRNVYLSVKTAMGKTKFSAGETPFQKDIARMVREIGIFLISITTTEYILSFLMKLVVGVDSLEMSISLMPCICGLIILCLSQVFNYGRELQADVDGLV